MGKKFSGRRPENQPVFTEPRILDFEKRRMFIPIMAGSPSPHPSLAFYDHQTVTNAPTGFPNRDDSVLSFDTITFTITPAVSTFDYYIAGVKYTKSSAENIIIADTSGIHLIYYDGSTLSESVNPNTAALEDILVNKAWVATIYWNTTGVGVAPLLADERHGAVMSGKTHLWLHNANGAAYGNGLTLSGYTEDTDSDAALTFELTDGQYADEDLVHVIIDGSPATQYSQQLNGGDASIPIVYKDASGVWVEDAASTLPYKSLGAGRLAFNRDDGGGSWSQVEVDDGKWVSVTLIATNDWQYPIKAIQGQNQYTDKKTAVEEATAEVISFGGGSLSPEVITLYRFVLRTKDTFGGTKKTKIEVDGVTDFRTSTVIGGAAVANDHGTLGGLADDDHAQYILHALATAANDFLVASGSSAFVKKTRTEVMALLSGTAGATFSWNGQSLTTLNGIGFTAESELTISGGAITVTKMFHRVDTDSDDPSDELDTINGGGIPDLIILRPENDARTIVIKHNTGNIWLQGKTDITLDDLEDAIMLAYDSTTSKWFDVVTVDTAKLAAIEASADVTDATNVAAAGALMVADLENPPTEDEANKAPTSEWAFDHNAAALSHLVHDNDNYFLGYGNETITDPVTNENIKIPALAAIDDPASGLDVSDWYGASGAYIQADADSDATHIQHDTADPSFPNSLKQTVVKWASNAAGTLNTGIGYIDDVDSDTLTIKKFTGVNFGASYYYWIKHSEWIAPVTGLYSVCAAVLFLPAEVNILFDARVYAYTGTDTPVIKAQGIATCSNASYEKPQLSNIINLTASDHVFLTGLHNGTYGTPNIFTSDPAHIPLQIFLLKQTA